MSSLQLEPPKKFRNDTVSELLSPIFLRNDTVSYLRNAERLGTKSRIRGRK